MNVDLRISPLDAIQSINFLTQAGLNSELPESNDGDNYPDVSGDGKVSPLDALRVINRLVQGINGASALASRLEVDSGPHGVPNLDFLSNQFNLEFGVSFGAGNESLEMRVGGSESTPFTSLGALEPNTQRLVSEAEFAGLFGSTVTDGDYNIEARLAGSDEVLSWTITIDTQLAAGQYNLAVDSDTGPLGDSATSQASVTVSGTTEPLATIAHGELTTQANALGEFEFSSVPLTMGTNNLLFDVTDLAGNQRTDIYRVLRYDTNIEDLIVSLDLATDTGNSDSDYLSSSADLVGRVLGIDSPIQTAVLTIDYSGNSQTIDVTPFLSDNGFFALSTLDLQVLLGTVLADQLIDFELTATTTSGSTAVSDLSVTLDRTSPLVQVRQSGGSSLNDFSTLNATTELVVYTDQGVSVSFNNEQTTTAGESGSVRIPDISLDSGVNEFQLSVVDQAGNRRELPVTLTRLSGETEVQLVSTEQFITDRYISLDLSVSERQVLELQVVSDLSNSMSNNALLDSDRLQLWLVDPSDPRRDLLAGETLGAPLVELTAQQETWIPGLVEGSEESWFIDLGLLNDTSKALLLVRLINHDSEASSSTVKVIATHVAEHEGNPPIFAERMDSVRPGSEIDVTELTQDGDTEILTERVLWNESLQSASILVALRPTAAIGRRTVLAISNLPETVELLDQAGQLPDGTPVVNMTSGLPSGGLPPGQSSEPVEIRLANPNGLPVDLQYQLLTSENQAPTIDPVAPVTVVVGNQFTTTLTAIDMDGDSVQYRLGSLADLPGVTLSASGRLTVRPLPKHVGTHSIEVIASDGAAESRQTIEVTVEADPVQTTRISGRVVDTKGQPLAGVPVSLSRISVITDSEGRFSIELPDALLPTEAFDLVIPTGDPEFDPFGTGEQTLSFRRARFDTAILRPQFGP